MHRIADWNINNNNNNNNSNNNNNTTPCRDCQLISKQISNQF